MLFANRLDAAHRLTQRLQGRALEHPLVLAIPRGGVPIGAAMAQALHADLDVVLARKLRHPFHSEYAVGAVGEDGEVVWNQEALDNSSVTMDQLQQEYRHQMREIRRRRELFRQGQPPLSMSGRSVILTDDGLATGSTALAALHVIRSQNPKEIILAVPVAAPERLAMVAEHCNECICLLTPDDFQAVAQFYEDFSEVTDEQVQRLLQSFNQDTKPAHH